MDDREMWRERVKVIRADGAILWFQTIQFSISTRLSSIWPIDMTLSGTTTPGRSEPGSDGNEGVLRIPQSSSIYWSLTIRLFSVISRTHVGGVLPQPN